MPSASTHRTSYFMYFFFFFFNDTATTEIYTLSLHDALPIARRRAGPTLPAAPLRRARCVRGAVVVARPAALLTLRQRPPQRAPGPRHDGPHRAGRALALRHVLG